MANTTMSVAYACGEMILGIAAMYVNDFRNIIRIFATPGLLIFLYLWIVPESVRWLLTTGKIDRAINTLKRIAKLNGRQLSQKSIEMIEIQYASPSSTHHEKQTVEKDGHVESQSVLQLMSSVFKSKKLCLRFMSCCYQYAACAFCYYGLGQSSTQIAGANRYISFIIVMGIEIPANILTQILLDRMNRKVLLCFMYILAAISVIATSTIPKEYSWAVLFCFVVGKASVTIAFTSLYMHTAEQWPTSIRNSIMNTCSMIGRVGSMIAPFVVVLVRILFFEDFRSFLSVTFEIIIFFVFVSFSCRVLISDHYHRYCLLLQQPLQLAQFLLIQKHLPKNYPIQLKKRKNCEIMIRYYKFVLILRII